mmetsp:Transcript_25662/g.37783  ORF Transcript_25662/g.37783 Transcript_25662/m.37783 type:complete len:174 (+) Transcript_25662:167-688(+)|eukprot:CAMPEP_0195518380 /NCGR_PEP_ID=MMETSP0794_2-20130614/12764_1 /TAXON_ID=515487 /ORGANISM="Stephanopyxis turris, Strain CCMP 815" /LENGTH=173 /DNA_ID=CAMNT_0040647329 /DNA_START=159 /DNA_END=680 /DNA_ORIENTATION=+
MALSMKFMFLAMMYLVSCASALSVPQATTHVRGELRQVPFLATSAVCGSFATPPASGRGLPLKMAASASPAVKKPEVKKKEGEKADKEKQRVQSKGWAVRLFNDPMNKREFVARCLMEVAGLTDGAAFQVMMQAHKNGVAVVGTYHQELAELYRNSLVERGLVCDMTPVDDDK